MYNGNMDNDVTVCSTDRCTNDKWLRRGICASCRTWSRKNDGADPSGRPFRNLTKRIPGETCTVVENGVRCDSPWFRGTLCNKHRLRLERHGDALHAERRSPGTGLTPVEYSRAYYNANRDEIAERRKAAYRANPEPVKARAAAWVKANPEKNAAQTMRYHARKMAAFVEDVSYLVLIDTHGRWCYLCESPIRQDEAMDMDHVIPLSDGGTHEYANMRPTHATCNRSKSDTQLHDLDLPLVPPYLLAGA